ncbi:MAG: DNA-binding protein WhiA [Oscillospiraceae bacterium]|jgi:DNA-binding protein WhiA|nr:DNA-binding protein WhiA [Oscillospiraceae bacterium]
MSSFAQTVKAELCRAPLPRVCCAAAESYGILLYCNTFSEKEIRIITESAKFSARTRALFRRAFGIEFDEERAPESGKRTLLIHVPEKLEAIFGAFGFSARETVSHHINLGALEEDCCRASLLRGAFLAGGSVSSPERDYHLELATPHHSVGRETLALLGEAGFAPKSAVRGGNFVTYFKKSSAIEDFLALIGAGVSAMELMNMKLEKDLRNKVNRRVNCDTANVTKAVDAAEKQLAAILAIQRAGALERLPDKLRETAEARLRSPELSITELAASLSPSVSKSCLNHRLRKLAEFSTKCAILTAAGEN